MKPSWKKYLLYASLIIVGGGLIFILVETVRVKNTGFETKTLWDWMELLIIPFVLAGGAYYLNWSDREKELYILEYNQKELKLQNYLNQMTRLLLENNLRNTKKIEVRDVARAWTINIFRDLDKTRKREVLTFLKESNLINIKRPIVDLSLSDLRMAWLAYINLKNANLKGVFMQNAYLEEANLEGTDLRGADLTLQRRFALLRRFKHYYDVLNLRKSPVLPLFFDSETS